MAAKGTKAYDVAVRGGEHPMSNADAFASLSHVLRVAADRRAAQPSQGSYCPQQWAVAHVDWKYSVWGERPISRRLPAGQREGPPGARRERRKRLRKARKAQHKAASGSESAARGRVHAFLQERMSAMIEDETLAALGVDSLDEVQMRNEFQREFGVKPPLALFGAPGQTLGGLMAGLEAAVDAKAAGQ